MSNYASLKSAIQQVIKTNGNNEITGALLQQSLLSMINSLGVGYQFVGIATPSTNPGTPDARVMYLAYLPGTYVNFGGLAVTGFCVLKYNTSWTKEDIPISSSAGGDTDFLTEPDDLTLEAAGDTKILKFANRSYNSDNPNGMGYKILRADKTFAEQVTLANTIYEIRYDFDLRGASVTIPAGCVLKFEGGKLSNGTITGNGAKINSPAVPIFSNCSISEFDCEAMPEWFGAKADGVTDDTDAMNLTFSAFRQVALITGRKYLINGTINMPYNGVIVGGYNTIILSTSSNTYPIFNLGYGCQVHNIKVELESLRTVFHIDTLYVQQTYKTYDSSADAYKYVNSAKIRVRDIDIICKADSSAQVNCIESFANGFGTGYWQIAFEAMTIYGDYEYAIYLDNGNTSGSSKSTWQTDLVFRDIKIGYSRNGIFVGKQDVVNVGTGMPPERVTFDSVSMQYMAGKTNNFALIDAGNRITFLNCEPWDWEGQPFSVNQAKTNGVTINNGAWFYSKKNVSVFGDISYGGVPAELFVGNNTGVYNINNFFSNDRLSEGRIRYNELTSLPIGCYLIPSDTKWNTFFGAEPKNKIVIGYYPAILRISRLGYNSTFAELFTFPSFSSSAAFSNQQRKSYMCYAYILVDTTLKALNEAIPGWITMQPELTIFDTIENFLDTPFYRYLREGFIGSQFGVGNKAPRFALKVSDNIAVDAFGYSFTDKIGATPPTVIANYDRGKRFYLTNVQKPIYYSGSVWNDALGNPYDALTKGPTASRPTGVKDGFFYFDTNLNKPIWYTGNGWVDATGASV